MRKTIICVAGRAGAGKSSIVKRIAEKYGLSVVKSYTTRQPRKDEIEKGLENADHIFISDAEFDLLNDIVAETTINGIRYCTTKEQLMASDLYVIDPIGIQSLCKNAGQYLHIVQFYVYADADLRKQRFMARGETEDTFNQRQNAESTQFSEYEKNHGYEILIYNNWELEKAVDVTDSYASLIFEDRIADIAAAKAAAAESTEPEEAEPEAPAVEEDTSRAESDIDEDPLAKFDLGYIEPNDTSNDEEREPQPESADATDDDDEDDDDEVIIVD